MNKILFLDNTKVFKNWASKTYEYKINQIKKNKKHYDYFDMDDNLSEIDITKYDTVIFGWNSIYISKYYTTKFNFYKKKVNNLETKIEMIIKLSKFFKIDRKFLIVQDLNCPHDYEGGLKQLARYLRRHKFIGIITPYNKTQATKYLKKNVPNLIIFHIPHHINRIYFKDWKLEKKYDVFIFGNISQKFYPFRNRLNTILKNNQEQFKLLSWNGFRNYFKFNKKISNDSLSKIINQSWLTICTPSKFDLLLGKYFETSMSGSVICGNMSTDGDRIWGNDYINITPNMTDDEIIDKIKTALNNKKKLTDISQNVYDRMNEFNLDIFSDKLYYIVSSIIN